MRNATRATALALLVILGGSVAPVHAEWSPPSQHHCTGVEWRTHKNGHCGWRTVHRLIRLVFSHGETYALCVGWRESRFYARATNGQYRGVFQFGRSWYAGKFNPYDPVANVERAWTGSHYGRDWHSWNWECGR